jgi:hypothetical protein
VTATKISALALLIAVAAGCGKLSENAQNSADNSLRAADATEMVLQTTTNAYGDGRQAASRTRRLEEITRLEQAQNLDGKLVAASAYFYSYEFQLWKQTGSKEDTDAKRQVLFAEGVAEFLKTASDYASPVATGENPNFMALALALHQINTRQLAAAQTYKFQPKSMLDLIQEGLASQAQVESGSVKPEQLPPYQLEVQKEMGVVVHLLQARYGALVGSVLQAISKADTELANLAMVQAQMERLQGARQTRQVLGTVGVGVVLPAPILQGAKASPVPESTESTTGSVAADLRKKKIGELIQMLKTEVGG